MRAGRIGQLGDAEIDQLDEVGAAIPVDEEDIVRLEVAVDDSPLVRRLQRPAALQEDGSRPPERERHSGLHERLQRPAVQELHHEVMAPAVGDVEIEDVDDVVVADDVHGLRFVEEALDDPLVRIEAGMEHLDRHLRADGGVLAHVDGAHSPFAEQLDDAPRADDASDHLVALDVVQRSGETLLLAIRWTAGSRIRHGR